MAAVFYILAAVCAVCAFLASYRSSERTSPAGSRLPVVGVLGTTAGMLWIQGYPLLAILASVAIVPAAWPRRAIRIQARAPSRLRWQGIPVLLAGGLGVAAPILIDARIETGNLPPPVEGSSAAVGGTGLAYAFLQRGLLISVAIVALLLLVIAMRGLTSMRDEGSSNVETEDSAA